MPGASAETLRVATLVGPPHPFIEAANFFKEEVEKRTNGEISVRIFPNASLGDEDAVLNELALGTIDVSISSTNNATKQVPELQVFDLYYLFPDYDVFNKAVDPDGPVFQRIQEIADERQLGYRFLSLFGSGSRNLSNSVRPVDSIEDVEGIKMRVPPNQAIARIWQDFGTVPVTVNWSELYAAVQTGVAEALESTISGYAGSKLYEVAPYLSLTHHTINGSYIVISQRTYDELSPEHRKIVEEVAAEAGRLGTRAGMEADESLARQLADEHGVEVTEPDLSGFIEVVEPLRDEMAESLGVTDLVDMVKTME